MGGPGAAAGTTVVCGKATAGFYKYVSDPERRLLTVTEHQGLNAAERIIAEMLQGKIDPGQGHVIRM